MAPTGSYQFTQVVAHGGYGLEDLGFASGFFEGGQDWLVCASGSGAGYPVRIPGLTRTHNPEITGEADFVKYN